MHANEVNRNGIKYPPGVAGDAGDLHDVQSFLEQPSGGLMAQVVEVKALDPGPAYCPHAGTLYRLGGDAGEDIAVQAAGRVASRNTPTAVVDKGTVLAIQRLSLDTVLGLKGPPLRSGIEIRCTQ